MGWGGKQLFWATCCMAPLPIVHQEASSQAQSRHVNVYAGQWTEVEWTEETLVISSFSYNNQVMIHKIV